LFLIAAEFFVAFSLPFVELEFGYIKQETKCDWLILELERSDKTSLNTESALLAILSTPKIDLQVTDFLRFSFNIQNIIQSRQEYHI